MKSLVDALLGIEREASVNLSGNLSGHNVQDLLSELNQKTVEGRIDLLVEILAVTLAVLHRGVNQLGIFGLLGGGEDERWVGGGVLWLVLADG